MIKILFMIPNLGQGGAEKVLVNLVNNMDKDKFDITIKKQPLKDSPQRNNTHQYQDSYNPIFYNFF